MKRTIMALAFITMLVATSCKKDPSAISGSTAPGEGVNFTEEQIDDIKNSTHPLRQGTTYFHSDQWNYSVKYPNSFKDFKRTADGFTCTSREGVGKLKVWGGPCGAEVEDILGQDLAEYNRKGAVIEDTDIEDDTAFTIQGEIKNIKFYQRTLLYSDRCATLYFEFDTSDRDDIDPEAVYCDVGMELGESLISGNPPVEPKPVKVDPNAVAAVAYVGTWHTFSTMRYEEPYKRYTEFKDVNAWEAQTNGKEVYLILAAHDDTKITVKNTKTGERLYNRDSRPLVVRCNENGEPDMEVTFISTTGKVTRYVPRHDENNHPILAPGISDMTK
ncbi:MAG: hypothetical protein IK092_06780 [Muribaculaceae bacterium]|nr:hypothetical protein [Muribaculaceae bacterium]